MTRYAGGVADLEVVDWPAEPVRPIRPRRLSRRRKRPAVGPPAAEGRDAAMADAAARGWSPVLAAEQDLDRVVLRISGWVGGTGDEPTVSGYVGAQGVVEYAAMAANVRGGVGPTGAGGSGGGAGPQGEPGPAGADGAQGPAGADGAQGEPGPAGADGAQGPAGPAGADGAQGPAGPAGADGAQGPAGADGATGPQGPQGDPGAAGATGPQGPQGDPGPSSLAPFTTNDLTEGTTNKYYTDERVDDRVASLMVTGLGLFWVYNDASNTLQGNVTLSDFSTDNLPEGTNLYYTNERVDDRVAALLQNSTGIVWTYNDPSGTLTLAVSATGVGFTPTGNIAATTVSGALAELDTEKVAKAGDTMTGDLTITKATPAIVLNKTTASGGRLQGQFSGVLRWEVIPGDGTTESGSNVGSNFLVARYSDAGSFIDSPLSVDRRTGMVTRLLTDLTANKTLNVNFSTGVDATADGSSGAPFKTIQKALDYAAATLNTNTFDVTIQLASGVTNDVADGVVLRNVRGSGRIIILGDATTPANCPINLTAATGSSGNGTALWARAISTVYIVDGVKFTTSVSGTIFCIRAEPRSIVALGNVEIGGNFLQCLRVGDNGEIVHRAYIDPGAANSKVTVSADCGDQFVSVGGTIRFQGPSTVVYSGTRTCGNFVTGNLGSELIMNALAFTGSYTGPKWSVSQNSVLNISSSAIPGTVAGTNDGTCVVVGDTPTSLDVDGTLAANSDTRVATQKAVKTYADTKAPLASPVLTGNPTAPTPSAGDNDTSIATTAFVTAAVAALIPSTSAMLFQQTSAPTGWTKQTTHNDKALRVVSGTASSGGTSAFSTVFGKTGTDSFTLSTNEIPAHNHDATGGHYVASINNNNNMTFGGPNSLQEAGFTTIGGSAGHSHGMDIRVQYVDLIIATKN